MRGDGKNPVAVDARSGDDHLLQSVPKTDPDQLQTGRRTGRHRLGTGIRLDPTDRLCHVEIHDRIGCDSLFPARISLFVPFAADRSAGSMP